MPVARPPDPAILRASERRFVHDMTAAQPATRRLRIALTELARRQRRLAQRDLAGIEGTAAEAARLGRMMVRLQAAEAKCILALARLRHGQPRVVVEHRSLPMGVGSP